MSRSESAISESMAVPPRQASWGIALLGLSSGAVLIPLNSTMVAVALPHIMTEFGITAGTVSWLVTLYLATVALAMPTSGSLGDRFGHRKMFVLGVVGFAVSSLIAALAWTFPVLVIARVLQAASGASMTPNAASILRVLAPEDRRGGSFGLLDMLTSVSATIGPLLGGLLVSGFGWRSMFILALPIALIAAVAVTTVVPASRPRRAARAPVDFPGLVLLSASLLCLLATLSVGRGATWTWGIAGAAAVLLVLFVRRELRVPVPAVDVRLFRVWPFATAVTGVLGATIVLHATLILVPILTQTQMHASATTSGLVLLGLSGLSALTAPVGGRLSDHIGRRIPSVIGSLITALGLGALWVWTGRASIELVGALLAVVGVGFGLSGSPRQTSALESVGAESTGMAAGAYYTGRYIGGVLGASLAGVVLGSAVSSAVVAKGFGILTAVALGVMLLSFGLRGRAVERVQSTTPEGGN